MKKHLLKWCLIISGVTLLQGCISVPPLVQVQHKEDNTDIRRRMDSIERHLDSIDRRLDALTVKPGDKT